MASQWSKAVVVVHVQTVKAAYRHQRLPIKGEFTSEYRQYCQQLVSQGSFAVYMDWHRTQPCNGVFKHASPHSPESPSNDEEIQKPDHSKQCLVQKTPLTRSLQKFCPFALQEIVLTCTCAWSMHSRRRLSSTRAVGMTSEGCFLLQ